jgi:uncharacterized protein YdiU (UPF0061 family)
MGLVNLKELSRLAEVAETNIRRYVEHFPTYIPCSMMGKLKMYSTDSIPVVKFIAKRYADKAQTDIIRTELEQDSRFQATLDIVEPEEARHAATAEKGLSTEVLAQAMAQQGEMLRQMVIALDKSKEVDALRQRVESMEDRNRKLDEVLRRLNEKKTFGQRVKEFLGRG